MYTRRSGLILGYHGCDKTVRDRIVSIKGEVLKPSKNTYDWLGNGIYFWENNRTRALEFAQDLKNKPPRGKENLIKEPAVLGAVIDLGNCLDLLDSEYIQILKSSYDHLVQLLLTQDKELPKNIIGPNGELTMRNLDCAVIETLHEMNRLLEVPQYDSVRGVFLEGKELYENAGFREKNHIQIAIRNPDCIKGYFVPRDFD